MKKALSIILALSLCLIMAACGQTADPEKPTDNTSTTAPTTTEAMVDWNVTSVDESLTPLFDDGMYGNPFEIDGLYVEADRESIYLVNAETNEKTEISNDGSWIYAFDGKTVLYLQERADPSVDYDKNYVISYEEEPIKPTGYYVDDVMQYDIVSGKTEKLFTKYCSGGGIVYFNDKDVYYEDILESQIGYKNGYDPYGVLLYRYDLTTGNRELLSDEFAFEASVTFVDGTAYLLNKGKLYDTAKHEWLEAEVDGAFQWAYRNHFYYVSASEVADDGTVLKEGIWDYNREDGTTKNLYEYVPTEDIQYVDSVFGGRYVLYGADMTRQQNEYTVTYGATKYKLYDLLLNKTIEVDPNEYDEITSVNTVLVTWMFIGDDTYQISYYDDDGNHELYDKWKVKGELCSITSDGYYVQTGENEDDNTEWSFVSAPLEFLQD